MRKINRTATTNLKVTDKLNVRGLKYLLRCARRDLHIKFYDADSYDDIAKMTIGELLQDCTYDNYEIDNFESQLIIEDDFNSPEDILNSYILNVGVWTNATCDGERTTVENLSDLYSSDNSSCTFGLMHTLFISEVRWIHLYDEEERTDIRTRLAEYMELPADSLTLKFDEYDLFDLWKDYGWDFDGENEYMELMSVEINPVLPDGMILFY